MKTLAGYTNLRIALKEIENSNDISNDSKEVLISLINWRLNLLVTASKGELTC
jgi:hypothetical protein